MVEIKTRGTGWSSEDEHELFGYYMQVFHGMKVTGCEAGLLIVLHGGYGGMHLETREVVRDDVLTAQMIELEQEIVDAVRTEQPPLARGTKSDGEAVKQMFGLSDGSAKRANREAWRWVKEARELKEQRDEVDRQYKERVQNIQVYMGDAEQLISPFDDQVCRWPTVTEHRFNAAAFKAAHPSIHAEFVRENSVRRFYLS